MDTIWREILTDNKDDADAFIMGIGFDGAASVGRGAAMGPEAIRKCSVCLPPVNSTGEFFENFRVYDAGDVEFTLDWEEYYDRTEKMALELLDTEKFCIFLVGDHSVTIPLSKALCQHYNEKKVGVIQREDYIEYVIFPPLLY